LAFTGQARVRHEEPPPPSHAEFQPFWELAGDAPCHSATLRLQDTQAARSFARRGFVSYLSGHIHCRSRCRSTQPGEIQMNARGVLTQIAASALLLGSSMAGATSHGTTPPPSETRSSVSQITGQQQAVDAQRAEELNKKAGCTTCHAVDAKKMGPSYQDIAKRNKDTPKAQADLVKKLKTGSGHPKVNVSDDELNTIVAWILAK
jgi:cytochrome c